MKLIKILSEGKPECGFRSPAAVLPAFGFALAVFAASVMAPAGCESPAGVGNGGEAVFAEEGAPVAGNAGGPAALSAAGTKTIKVRFEVLNGGWGVIKSYGVVSTRDDSHLNWGFGELAEDFDIEITVPASETYLNVRWKATDFFWKETYLKSGIQLEDGKGTYPVVLDYNGRGKVATKNLLDVSLNTEDVNNDFYNALIRAGNTELNEDPATKKINVKFEVLNGGRGLGSTEGIVTNQGDSHGVGDYGTCANDFTITITVPASDEYLNIRWRAEDFWFASTYVKAKMRLPAFVAGAAGSVVNYTITLDYNGRGKVAVKNLYDVSVAKETPELLDEWRDTLFKFNIK